MQLNSTTGGQQVSWLDRIGIFPPLLWGYVGLLFFMIGDGVESGYLVVVSDRPWDCG